MKKRLASIILALTFLLPINAGAFEAWDSPRYIPADEYKTPWTEAENPFVTYYAPWLKNFHIMTASEAENNKASGLVGGEAFQMVRQLAISPVNSDIMYLCSDTNGIYKTTNGGKHWYSTTNNAAGHDAKGLLCDNQDEKIVYVHMRGVGVHRSCDGGYSWHQLIVDTDSVQDVGKRSETIAQDESGNTYFAVGSGIYKLERTTDKLTNLTAEKYPALASLTGGNGAEFLDLDVSADGKYIYACCALTQEGTGVDSGLYVSSDSGKTWKIIKTDSGYTDFRTLAISPENPQVIYTGVHTYDTNTQKSGEYCLYVSRNMGESFTKLYRPQDLSGINIKFYGLKFGPKNAWAKYPLYLHLEGTVWPLRVSYNYTDSSPSFLEVYTRDDKMDTGTIREGYTGLYYQAFQPDMSTKGSNNVRVVYAASGIYEYTGEYKFYKNTCATKIIKRISSGYSGASIEDIAFNSKNNMCALVVDSRTFVDDAKNVYGKDAYPTFTGEEAAEKLYGVRGVFDPNNDDNFYAYVGYSNGSGTYSGIRKSTDGGKTFGDIIESTKIYTKKQSDASASWTEFGNAQVLCYANDNRTIYSSYHQSPDNGSTWVKNEYFLLDVFPENTDIQVGIKKENGKLCLYKTDNAGESWSFVTDYFNADSNFSDVDFDLGDSNFVWFIYGDKTLGKINLSTGEIIDFTDKAPFSAYRAFSDVEVNPKDSDHILVTSSPGTYIATMKDDYKLAESYDGGNTWHVVPGLWGGLFNNIIFSKTTEEAFITGHSGTFIYDYNKFNYYQRVNLIHNNNIIKTTLQRVNEDGKHRNNGEYVISPSDIFSHAEDIFNGWIYNGTLYKKDDLITIGK